MKNSAFVVNVARGGLIDEADLDVALRKGDIAGAAIDVFVQEPADNVSFIELDQVVTTPHLGASTREAQEKAGISVAKSVRLALSGDLMPDAVNVAGGAIDQDVRPGIPLAENLGRILTSMSGNEAFTRVEVKVVGEIASKDVSALKLSALKGVFTDVVSDKVSYVNAPVLAEQQGIDVELVTGAESEYFRNEIVLTAALANGENVTVAGTVTGPKHLQKITNISGYDLETPITDHLLILEYKDRPGMIAGMSTLLGTLSINIAGMQVSRLDEKSTAVAVFALDSAPNMEVVEAVKQVVSARHAAIVDLSD